MSEFMEVPTSALRFKLDVGPEIRLADKPAEGQPPERDRFRMLVTSGEEIPDHWLFGNLHIDLSGIKYRQKLPVLLDHDTGQRVGHTDSIEVTDDGLMAEGFFLKRSAAANAVLDESRDGFPWEASCHLANAKIENVDDGDKAEVNGKQISGPATIFRESRLRECTFTAVGADSQAHGEALSSGEKVSLEVITGKTDMKDEKALGTTEEVKASKPDLDEIRRAALDEGASTALADERLRISRIQKAATASQAVLAAKLIADGTAFDEALEQLSTDPTRNVAELRKDYEESAPGAVELENEGAKIDENDPEAVWASDATLRDYYKQDKGVFLAAFRNRDRVGNVAFDMDGQEFAF